MTDTIELQAITLTQLDTVWKDLAKRKANTSQGMALYILLQTLLRAEGFQTQKLEKLQALVPRTLDYLKRAFPPITNATKKANGRTPYDTLQGILWMFNYPNAYNALPGIDLTGEAQYNTKTFAKLLLDELRMESRA